MMKTSLYAKLQTNLENVGDGENACAKLFFLDGVEHGHGCECGSQEGESKEEAYSGL